MYSGSDLRGVKDLIQKKNAIDQDIAQLEKKITHISEKGQKMIHEGHYDSKEILGLIDCLVDSFNGLQDPLDRRRIILEESLKWHQLAFDADVELQWIEEKRVVESRTLGRSLTEAMNMLKKQDQLDAEVAVHHPRVRATLDKGQVLIRGEHMSSSYIQAKCDQVLKLFNH